MKRSTIKVAELATIFYAILVLMSLLIDTAYYSQFNIRIVSYMSITEILLSCLENFYLYAPSLIFVGICLAVYIVYWVDPIHRIVNLYARLKGGETVKQIEDYSRLNFYFGSKHSLHAKYSVVSKYNDWFKMLPLMVIFSSLYPYQSIVLNYTSGQVALVVLFLIYIFVFLLFVGNYKQIEKTYDWTDHPTLEKQYFRDPIRKKIAAYHFSSNERAIIEFNYRFRHAIVCIIFFISMFIALCLAMFYSAKEVIEKGNDYCVVLKSKDTIVDTRMPNIDYIGECAGYIFVYDRVSRGTHVYERSSLDSYLIVKQSMLAADTNLYELGNQNIVYSSHVKESISKEIVNCCASEINEYFIDYNNSQNRLIDHQLNHYVWYDSINCTYLEQLTIPKSLFECLPSDNDIFMLDGYVKDEDRTKQYRKTAIECTYQGTKGEKIKTMVCKGMDYCAWLFYDESGKNIQLGDQIFNSIKSKYTPWQQLKIQYRNSDTQENILLLFLLCFFLGLNAIVGFVVAHGFYNAEDQGNKTKIKIKKKDVGMILGCFLLFMICIYYTEKQEIPFGIAGEIITLYFLVGNCVVFGMGYVLGLILKFKQIHK